MPDDEPVFQLRRELLQHEAQHHPVQLLPQAMQSHFHDPVEVQETSAFVNRRRRLVRNLSRLTRGQQKEVRRRASGARLVIQQV